MRCDPQAAGASETGQQRRNSGAANPVTDGPLGALIGAVLERTDDGETMSSSVKAETP